MNPLNDTVMACSPCHKHDTYTIYIQINLRVYFIKLYIRRIAYLLILNLVTHWELRNHFSAFNVPQAACLITRSSQQFLAIWAEGHLCKNSITVQNNRHIR